MQLSFLYGNQKVTLSCPVTQPTLAPFHKCFTLSFWKTLVVVLVPLIYNMYVPLCHLQRLFKTNERSLLCTHVNV